MITKNNYLEIIEQIGLKNLTADQQQAHENIVRDKNDDIFEELMEDVEYAEVVNAYFKSLEPLLKQQEKATEEAPVPKKSEKKQTTKAPKAKKEKQTKAILEPKGNPIPKFDASVRLIKQFVKFNGKTIERMKLKKFIISLQKAIINKEIPKTDRHATNIMELQEFCVNTYNSKANSYKIEISEDRMNKLIDIAESEHDIKAVNFIRAFLNMYKTKRWNKENAKVLREKINKAVLTKVIPETCPYMSDVEYIKKQLDNFIVGHDVKISEIQLRGLAGICSCRPKTLSGGLGNPFLTAIATNVIANLVTDKKVNDNKPKNKEYISSKQIDGMEFKLIGLQGKFKTLMGDPTVGFSALLYGLPKGGKSTIAIEFAKHLAKHHGKVLYCAVEEKYGYTLQEKLKRMDAVHENLFISEKVPTDVSEFDFVFIDSISSAGLSTDELQKIKANSPKTAFIFIFHSTKDGNFRGSQQFAHDQDVLIRVDNGIAYAKGRFAVANEVNFFDKNLA